MDDSSDSLDRTCSPHVQPQPSSQPNQQAEQQGNKSHAWQNAIQLYLGELGRGGLGHQPMDQDLYKIQSPTELLAEVKKLQTSSPASESIISLQKVVSSLNDFAAVVALALGMNGKVAAALWGAFQILFKLSRPVFPEIVKMLGKLESALPRFKKYEEQLPVNDELQDALCKVYSDVIVFCGHSIAFFRNNPNFARSNTVMSRFNQEFIKTVNNIEQHSQRVDQVVDLIRLEIEKESSETIKAFKDLTLTAGSKPNTQNTCHSIPQGINPQFLHRESELHSLKLILGSEVLVGPGQLKVAAIYGLGGVGKTQLALHYANLSTSEFPIIIWIPSETRIKMYEAVASIFQKLGLSSSDNEEKENIQAVLKLKDWLNSCDQKMLLVFDNVEDIDVVLPLWPSNANVSLLITSRSLSVASKRSKNVLHISPLGIDSSIQMLYAFSGQTPNSEVETKAADEICQLLGGLPLALVQMGQFIRERGSSFEEFLKIYKKSSSRIHARGTAPPGYDYTIDTVWDLSIEKLTLDARNLQNLLAFFDPDAIPEVFFLNEKLNIDQVSFAFFADELEFGDAVSELLRLSLLNRSSGLKALAVHRLLQTAILSRLPQNETISLFNLSVHITSLSFPNTWGNEDKAQQGHGYEFWETCRTALPHIQRLIEIYTTRKLKLDNEKKLAELCFRAGRYLWEVQQPTAGLFFLEFGLSLQVDRGSLMCNYALRMLGHAALDMAKPHLALKAYNECLEMRLKHFDANNPEIANVYDSIACSYTEMGDPGRGLEYLDRAKNIHIANDPSQMSRTDAIYAMTYLRSGQPNEALKSLKRCWDSQGLSEETIALSCYPKHSGDMVLLSRIYDAVGQSEDALQQASKSLNVWKEILGARGPRVADSMYIVAGMLRKQNKQALGSKLLRDIIEMSRDILEMRGHLARAL